MSKGVTPVVATVLLIAVTVAATGTVYTLIQKNTQQAKQQIRQVDLDLGTDPLKVETCYNQDSETHVVLRNNARDAINASEITPLLNGTIQEKSEYDISKEIVNPQRSFTINFSKKFYSSTLIIFTDGEAQIRHTCYDL